MMVSWWLVDDYRQGVISYYPNLSNILGMSKSRSQLTSIQGRHRVLNTVQMEQWGTSHFTVFSWLYTYLILFNMHEYTIIYHPPSFFPKLGIVEIWWSPPFLMVDPTFVHPRDFNRVGLVHWSEPHSLGEPRSVMEHKGDDQLHSPFDGRLGAPLGMASSQLWLSQLPPTYEDWILWNLMRCHFL